MMHRTFFGEQHRRALIRCFRRQHPAECNRCAMHRVYRTAFVEVQILSAREFLRGLRLPVEYIIDAVGEDDSHSCQENACEYLDCLFHRTILYDMQYTTFSPFRMQYASVAVLFSPMKHD